MSQEEMPTPGGLEQVDLELILAVDVSYSVDAFEARTQRDGYVAALTSDAVINAITSGFHGKIAVTYVEWADAVYQNQLVDWTIISDQKSAQAFADQLNAAPLNRAFYTSISHIIDYSISLLEDNRFEGLRGVIDISGDGVHNQGRPLADARQAAIDKGFVINGLPILNDRPQPVGILTPKDLELDLYYADNVIGGPGAFMVVAENFDDFRAAILSKLVREIASAPEQISPDDVGGPRIRTQFAKAE